MIWVYPKEGGKPFRKPTSWCTAETDFQSTALEKAQADFIESPGIKALRNLMEGKQSESEYNFTLRWIALHLIRNQKMRDTVVKDGEDYEKRFPEEFEKEVLYLKSRYAVAYSFKTSNFFITSDNPIMEICCSEQRLLFFAFSPQIFFRLSSEQGELTHGTESFEDFANAMTWSAAHKFIFSNRNDIEIDKYIAIASKREMIPRQETERVILKGYTGELASKFSPSK